ncbi:hypothetical protein HYQ46_004388 [Verticillium longisporum]|nr:hypothetical protein HYQ46_004388 [Verticillium longisporum]
MNILGEGHNNRDEFVQQNATDIKQSTYYILTIDRQICEIWDHTPTNAGQSRLHVNSVTVIITAASPSHACIRSASIAMSISALCSRDRKNSFSKSGARKSAAKTPLAWHVAKLWILGLAEELSLLVAQLRNENAASLSSCRKTICSVEGTSVHSRPGSLLPLY